MAKITPTQNTSDQNQDPLVLSTSTTARLKRAVDGSSLTPTGSDYAAAAEMTGSHVSGEVFAATDVLSLIGGMGSGGTIYPLEAGTASSGTALVLHVRDVGPAGTMVAHAINVTSGTVAIGTGLSTGRKHIEIYNAGTGTVYLGHAQVGTASGFPLGTAAYAYFDSGHAWYATVAAGTSAVRVLELG
jgi:hypothetical protein